MCIDSRFNGMIEITNLMWQKVSFSTEIHNIATFVIYFTVCDGVMSVVPHLIMKYIKIS